MYKTPAQMLEVGRSWMDDQLANEQPLTVTGLAMALGFTSRQALINYEGKPAFVDAVKSLKLAVESFYERHLFTRNPAGAIFGLKNFGWTDTQILAGPGGGPLQTVIQVNLVKADPQDNG